MKYLKKVFTYITVFSTVLWSIGIPLLPFTIAVPKALAAAGDISGVALADTDSVTPNIPSPGLDGRDFKVTWTPDMTTPTGPSGYVGTKIFIVPNGTSLTTGNLFTNGCGGSACQDRGFLNQYMANMFTVPDFFKADSANATFTVQAYKACVLIDAGTDQLLCSSAMTPTSDSVTDTNRPFIQHTPTIAATESANAIINTIIRDDQTIASDFINGITGAAIRLFYGANLSLSSASSTPVQVISGAGDLFQFTVTSATVGSAGNTFQYYLKATDKANNTAFSCANPNAVSDNDCKSSPFMVTVIPSAGAQRSIAGTIRSGGSALAGAKVFIGGYAKAAATTDGAGAYSVTGLPNNNSFEITAYKNGYCDNKRFESIASTDLTGMDLNLNAGDCSFVAPPPGGGTGGTFNSGGKPHVVFSGPPDNMTFVSVSEKIRVGFDQALNASTVNDSVASDAGSKVYLTTTGSDQVAGTVTYCENQSSAGCSAIFSQDQNTILFTPAANLAQNTFYTLVITEGVTSSSGQSVEGNRSGGGHQIRFTTGGETFNFTTNPTQYGMGGASMPPYVQAISPGPGIQASPNIKPLISFNEGMNTTTLTTTNIKLVKKSDNSNITITVTPDGNTGQTATLTPSANLALGDYEVRVLGAVANTQGVTMRGPNDAAQIAFSGFFTVSGSADTTPPSIFPAIIDGSTGVAVNKGYIDYGFSKQLDPTTVTTSTVTMARGSTSVPISVQYQAGVNNVNVIPTTILANNTTYSVTFGTGVKDIYGNALASAGTYSFTTGSADTTAPKIIEARCDDYSCNVKFNEPMNGKVQADGASGFAASVLNRTNITLASGVSAVTKEGGTDLVNASSTAITLSYDPVGFAMKVQGFSTGQLTIGGDFAIRIEQEAADMAGNALGATGNVIIGKVEDSKMTFGSFGGDGGMFGPPTTSFGGTGSTTGGFEFKPEGFGNFTASQFAFGEVDMAFPFNPMASADVNVFQVGFKPDVALQNGDLVEITFPTGTGIANAVPDTFSPFYKDMNEAFGAGTVIFEPTYDSDGVSVDESTRTVTVKLKITGTPGPGATDRYKIDLRKITNPAIPKGPDTGGYTATIKVKRGTSTIATKTSMPYFIQAGGSRTITVKVYAGTVGTGTVGADGTIFLHGGGNGGPMDKSLTLTNGKITAADGTAIANDAGVVYSNLPDGCYFFGTEPFVSLGGVDYFGQMSPEPLCVNSGNTSATKNLVLTSSASTSSATLTVKLAGIADFGGVDVDIFCGGPGKFVVKNLASLGAPASAGYTVKLNSNGRWFCGVGPGMPKGTSGGIPKQLPGVPPPPIDLNVSSIDTTPAISTGFRVPPGITFNSSTNTLTFSFIAATKVVSGTVTDGTTGLANVQVFMHSQGFGAPTFATTKSDGTFSISVSDYGSYEIGIFKDGLPPVFNHLEIRPDGTDAGTDIDIFFKGQQITGANPLVIKVKKGAYTISGKVLDSNNNGISNAMVFAEDANGNFVNGNTSSDGSYTIFVDAAVWTVKSQLPPDKTDSCGTFSKTVTVTNANQANQNITPTAGTCYTLKGKVTIAGAVAANTPLFVGEWNTTTDRPVAGGLMKPSSTNSSGIYEVKVAGSKTYRVGTFHPDYGELSKTVTVAAADIDTSADANGTASLNSGTTGTVTFAFTGGVAANEAFAEIKRCSDGAACTAIDNFTRLSKGQKGLNNNITFTAKDGTYKYFVNVFGIGEFSGTVATGATATIDLSSSTLVTLSGTVKDNAGAAIAGANISVKGTDGLIKTVTTNADDPATASVNEAGTYSVAVKSGTYTVSAGLTGYVAGQAPASVALTGDTPNYDFGGTVPDQSSLTKADKVITGTVLQSTGSAAKDGFVSATNSAGITVTAPVDAQNGSYSLPVTDDTWTLTGVASLHDKTTKTGTITVAGASVTNASTTNITLAANANKSSKTTSTSLTASTGGTVNDIGNTDIKLGAAGGVLETGSGNVSITMSKTFTAPDTGTLKPVGDAAFDISATSSSGAVTKTLSGNAEIQISYGNLTIPTGVSESDLKLVYYSPEKGEYVPVEGGFTVDTVNNTVTGQTNHFTSFAIVYAPTASSTTTPTSSITAPPAGGFVPPSASQQQPKVEPAKKSSSKELAQAPQKMVEQKKVASRIDQIQRIVNEAKKLLSGKVTDLLALVGAKRDLAKEQKVDKGLAAKVIGKLKIKTETRTALTNFIAYGTPETIKLGDGERAGVADSFKEAFGRVPANEKDWGDVLKIAVGRWPEQRSAAKEKLAEATFKTIYGHSANRKDQKEDAAVTVMAYGLRPAARNTASEKAAILSYRAIFKSDPKDAKAWNAVRAIAYSGAQKTAGKTKPQVAGERVELPSAVFDRNLSPGDSGADVGRLQQLLASDAEVYEEGTVNGSYGALTKEAVGKFQLKYGVVNSRGDPGYGYVGARTREKLQEIFGR